jgi:predicted HTH domain antitoxin
MRTITLSLPENIDLDNKEIMMILAASLYEKSKLSAGQAADLAGISKRNFIENLGNYGVSIFNFPASELTDDVKNIQI